MYPHLQSTLLPFRLSNYTNIFPSNVSRGESNKTSSVEKEISREKSNRASPPAIVSISADKVQNESQLEETAIQSKLPSIVGTVARVASEDELVEPNKASSVEKENRRVKCNRESPPAIVPVGADKVQNEGHMEETAIRSKLSHTAGTVAHVSPEDDLPDSEHAANDARGPLSDRDTRLARNKNWFQRYKVLCKLKARYGNLRNAEKAGSKMKGWIKRQRLEYKKYQRGIAKCHLTLDMIEALTGVGFDFQDDYGERQAAETEAQKWEKRMELFRCYHKTHGHLNFGTRNESTALLQAASAFRSEYCRSMVGGGTFKYLTEERTSELLKMGFIFGERGAVQGQQNSDGCRMELEGHDMIKEANGKVFVHRSVDKDLYDFIASERLRYSQGTLSDERVKVLKDLEDLELVKDDQHHEWAKHFEALSIFKLQHGAQMAEKNAVAAAKAAAAHLPAPPLKNQGRGGGGGGGSSSGGGAPGATTTQVYRRPPPAAHARIPVPHPIPPPNAAALAHALGTTAAVRPPAPPAAVRSRVPAGAPAAAASQSDSKYSAERIRARKYSDGSVRPATMPKRDKNGLYIRPAGRRRKGMDWDAVKGVWIPSDNPDPRYGE